MKLTAILLTIAFLQVHAKSFPQVTLSLKNAPMEKVFFEIERQAGFGFLYTKKMISHLPKVTIQVKNASVNEVLNECFKGQPIEYSIEDNMIVVKKKEVNSFTPPPGDPDPVPPVQITGRVVTQTGEPLPDVSVIIVGLKTGTTTNSEGRFTITSPDNKNIILEFSSVGYLTKRVNVGNQTEVNVVLELDVAGLDDVVVVGYGTQKKVNLTGAVVTLDAKDIQDRPITQTSQALQGKVSGVTVTQNFGIPGSDGGAIKIRGIGTLGNNNPLVLIDGIEGDINQINPQDIESISILKDAASSSIYGSRAAKGVILISTNRSSVQDIQITYSGLFGVQLPTNLPKVVDGQTYLSLKNENERNSGRPNLFSEDYIDKYFTNVGNEPYFNTNWYKAAMKSNSYQQSNNISVQGGTKRVSGIVTFSNLWQDALIENADFNRQTFRFNTNFKASEKLSFVFDGSLYKHSQLDPSIGTNTIFEMMTEIPPIYPALWNDGTYGEGWNGGNPLALLEKGGSTKIGNSRVLLNIQAKYQFSDWIGLELRYSPKFLSTYSTSMRRHYKYRRSDNSEDNFPRGRNSLSNSYNKTTENFYQGLLRINKAIQEHNFSFFLGYEAIDNKFVNFSASRENFLLQDYEVLSGGDEFYDNNSGGAHEFSLLSYFGRLNYSYKSKYLFEANLRYDGSSRFSKENRWGTFPSFSIGWRVNNEAFLEDVQFLSNLKLRASWGRLGNQDIGYYPYQTLISINLPRNTVPYSFGKTSAPGGAQIYLPSKNISWETTQDMNFGIDYGFFENRLRGSLDIYRRTTFDILYRRDIPSLMGLEPSEQNIAKVENKGWDLQLSWNDKIRDFGYNVDVVLSDVKNKVLNLNGKPQFGRNIIFENEEYLSYYGFENIGIYKSEEDLQKHPSLYSNVKIGDLIFKDLNKDGKIDDINDKKIIGSNVPRYNFGLALSMNFKRFDFDIFLQGVGKKNLYHNIFTSRNGGTFYNYQLGRLIPDDPSSWQSANWPRIQEGDQGSTNNQDNSFYLFNAAYIRCKNLSLGYNLPLNVINKLKLNGFRLYITGQNIFKIDKLKKYSIDPESPDVYMYGTDFYPNTKTIAIGVNVKF